MFKKLPIIIFSLAFSFWLFVVSTNAQELSSGLAIEVPIEGEASAGDLLCSSGNSFAKCTSEYQTSMYGVVVDSSALEITDTELQNSKLVITSGIARVKVTAANGEIKKGNLLTSSNTEGLAQLASKNGYILGTALEDFSGTGIGSIQVVININLYSGTSKSGTANLIQFIRQGLTIPIFEPLESFRYLLAAIMIIISFTLGLVYFGRSSRSGIEAIGRNPLAKQTIQITIFLNIILTVVIVFAGLGIAYLILIL